MLICQDVFIFVLAVMRDLIRSCCASATVYSWRWFFPPCYYDVIGLAGDGSFLHAILMDIVVLEMFFLYALVMCSCSG